MPLNRRLAGVAVLAALAGLAVGAAPSLAQQANHPHAGVDQMTEQQREELHRQLTALLAVTLAKTDFDALDKHFATLIRANASEIGGDADALAAHVSAFLRHAAEAGRSDPQGAAAHMTQALMQVHMHGE